jgi:hypothetical protein
MAIISGSAEELPARERIHFPRLRGGDRQLTPPEETDHQKQASAECWSQEAVEASGRFHIIFSLKEGGFSVSRALCDNDLRDSLLRVPVRQPVPLLAAR